MGFPQVLRISTPSLRPVLSLLLEHAMLEIRQNCECCNRHLPNESLEAYICTFECTFCSDCCSGHLAGICPNCGGELVRRPRRPAAMLVKYPASTERVFKPEKCQKAG